MATFTAVPPPESVGAPKPRILGEKYEVGQKLGSGLQGKVYLGKNLETGAIVALKVMEYNDIQASRRRVDNLSKELNAMSRLRGHPHVISLIDYMMPIPMERRSTGVSRDVVLVVLEIAEQGELFDFMSHTGPFSEPIARFYFQQLLDALSACHAKGVFHRDLKPENLLLDRDFNLKVADFGLSALVTEESGAATLFHTECGTPAYMAPEVMRRVPYSGEKADLWSAAAVLFIMVCGFPPMRQASPGDWWYDRVREGRHALFWQAHERSFRFSADFKNLINRIFVDDPARRASLAEIMEDPWVTGEIPSAEVVKEDLRRRAETVAQRRAEERRVAEERARARRAAPMALNPHGTGTLRSGGAGEEGEAAPARRYRPGPVPPAHAYVPHEFYVDGSADEVVGKVRTAAEGLGGEAEVLANPGDVRVVVRSPDSVVFEAGVFEAGPELFAVRGVKMQGDSLRFAQLFDELSLAAGPPVEGGDDAAVGGGEGGAAAVEAVA